METQGILFIATGKKYVQAAIRAARTVRKYSPGLDIHLFTDVSNYDDFRFETLPEPFTSVGKIGDPHPRSKVDFMAQTPYDRTLYLDTDTALNADIRGMFRLLDRFDVAMTHAHRRGSNRLRRWRASLPSAFPEFNTGVVLFRKTPAVLAFLKEWWNSYKETNHLDNDQTTQRELLWLSDLRIATLPPEYNVRFLKFHFSWSRSEAVTKIFHLKQYHLGWLEWLNMKSGATRRARKLGLSQLINLIKDRLR
jgi:hypothetical protein